MTQAMTNRRPLCRYCGKLIAKKTTTVYFVATEEERAQKQRRSAYSRYVVGAPTTKQEAQRLLNETVVSIRRGGAWNHTESQIDQVSTWDGESYVDRYFCNSLHAQKFGYAAAQSNPKLAMPAYHNALREVTTA